MIAPRLHLELLLNEVYELSYLSSLAGVFNLASVLAHLHRNAPLQANFDTAQKILITLIEKQRLPIPEEGSILRQAFNQADSYIGLQNTVSMAKAIQYSDAEHAAGRTTPVGAEAP